MNLPLFPALQPRAALPALTDGAATDRGPAEPGTWEHAGQYMVGESSVPPSAAWRPWSAPCARSDRGCRTGDGGVLGFRDQWCEGHLRGTALDWSTATLEPT